MTRQAFSKSHFLRTGDPLWETQNFKIDFLQYVGLCKSTFLCTQIFYNTCFSFTQLSPHRLIIQEFFSIAYSSAFYQVFVRLKPCFSGNAYNSVKNVMMKWPIWWVFEDMANQRMIVLQRTHLNGIILLFK